MLSLMLCIYNLRICNINFYIFSSIIYERHQQRRSLVEDRNYCSFPLSKHNYCDYREVAQLGRIIESTWT